MTLPINKISEIAHKSTVLSSPALSAKRIGIRYGLKIIVIIAIIAIVVIRVGFGVVILHAWFRFVRRWFVT